MTELSSLIKTDHVTICLEEVDRNFVVLDNRHRLPLPNRISSSIMLPGAETLLLSHDILGEDYFLLRCFLDGAHSCVGVIG